MSHLLNKSLRVWQGIWGGILLLIFGIIILYSSLPLDGTTGDLQSFTSQGFLVKKILEERGNGLQVGDIITHIEGYSIEELLHSPPDTGWRSKKSLSYEILRDGKSFQLQIPLKRINFVSVLQDWAVYQFSFFGYLLVGTVVFRKRPHDPAARWLMLYSMVSALQGWADAYNFQPATLLWQGAFWFHVVLEQVSYSAVYASILLFVLTFPQTHRWLHRYPRLLPTGILTMGLVFMLIAMVFPVTRTEALALGDRVIVYPAMLHLATAVIYAIYSLSTQKDPLLRSQSQWIMYGSSLAILVAFVGYGVPLALTGKSLVSRQVLFLSSATVPISFAIAIFRYRLFDIDIIINRTLVYSTLTALLGGIYLLLVSLLTIVAQTFTSADNQNIVVFISTLTISFAFQPLRKRVQKMIDSAFFRSKVDYRSVLPEMSAKLANNIDLEKLTQLLTEEIPRRLEVSGASLQIFDTNESKYAETIKNLKPSDFQRQKLSIPLIVGKSISLDKNSSQVLVGQYNLEAKLSGKPYSDEEIKLLTTLAKQAAVSVDNARLYQKIERYNRNLEQKVYERTQQLEHATDTAKTANILLEKVLNNINAYIYVSDMKTGEILFANRPMLEFYGDIQGEICWEVFQTNQTSPCDFCTSLSLIDKEGKPKGVLRRETQDQNTKFWYSNMNSAIQWVDGRIVRLSTRSDITSVKKAEALLLANKQTLARDEERRRLARDLHDTLTQSLHSLVLMADTSQRLLEKKRYEVLPDSVELLGNSARQALREMRLLLHELQLSEDAEINLKETLGTRLSIVEQRVGIKTDLSIRGQNYLSRNFKREIFYIILESLNNTLRHANASQISISIRASLTRAEILIQDNGHGFDTRPLVDKGMGFQNMQTRAKKLRGILKITSSPSEGTIVLLTIDLKEGYYDEEV